MSGYTKVDGSGYAQGDYFEMRLLAETLSDLMEQRVRITNRYERAPVKTSFMDEEVVLSRYNEERVRKQLVAHFRTIVPEKVLKWIKTTKGIGEPGVAHLLGHLGHPHIATPFHWEGTGSKRELIADPMFYRSLRELWAYCAIGDTSRRRYRTDGERPSAEQCMKAGNPTLRVLTHRLADSSIKNKDGRYRDLYVARRDETSDRVHVRECQNRSRYNPNGCGIAAHREWGAVGAPWRPGHQHADALRIVGKEILRDLYNAYI